LDAYLNDAMGVRFDALSRFAQPLFELYGINLQSSLSAPPSARSVEEMSALLTALDTARLLWAYFSMEPDQQDAYMAGLRTCLIGSSPDAEAKKSFRELMDLMHERWAALPGALRRHADDTAPSALPSFETLLDQHGPSTAERASTGAGYGPEHLEKPEALALFAQPLLDGPEVHTNPDALEHRMALATAYWDLAQSAPAHRDNKLQALLHRFADSPDDRNDLQQEARRMIDRFETLFPEHAA
jgi:hypothetical protein